MYMEGGENEKSDQKLIPKEVSVWKPAHSFNLLRVTAYRAQEYTR